MCVCMYVYTAACVRVLGAERKKRNNNITFDIENQTIYLHSLFSLSLYVVFPVIYMYNATLYTYSPVRIGPVRFVKLLVALLKNHRPYRTSVFQLAWRVKMCCAQLNRFRFTAKRERKQLEEFPHRRWYSHTYNHRLVFYYILNYTLKKTRERETIGWRKRGGRTPALSIKEASTVESTQQSQVSNAPSCFTLLLSLSNRELYYTFGTLKKN
jgi:hypothetical protein